MKQYRLVVTTATKSHEFKFKVLKETDNHNKGVISDVRLNVDATAMMDTTSVAANQTHSQWLCIIRDGLRYDEVSFKTMLTNITAAVGITGVTFYKLTDAGYVLNSI